MSLIGLVPRLTSWGSGLRLDKEILKKISGSQENAPKENEWPNERRKQKKKQRARISYWSDSEEITIRRSARWFVFLDLLSLLSPFLFRKSNRSVASVQEKERFVTTWRPKSTFGYNDNFKRYHAHHNANRQKLSQQSSVTPYSYKSVPRHLDK